MAPGFTEASRAYKLPQEYRQLIHTLHQCLDVAELFYARHLQDYFGSKTGWNSFPHGNL